MNSNKPQLPAGVLVDGRYIVLRPLGQGGMAHVYLAEDQQTGGQVAIKVMKDDLTGDPEFIKRFDTEARSASSLDHPNIVKVLGYGQDQDLRYIVQEYVEGSTLKDLIQQKGALDWNLAVPLAIQIGLALEHAHKRGVVHRDIKPQNILITSDMIAKVTDFGIARATNANTITLTSGVAFGSVHYFSPEQARGGVVGEKSDLYSLGIILFEMLTGQLPFDGETSVAVAIKHLQEMPPLPSTLQPELPAALDKIIMKCIQKNPESRYVDARELVDELDSFMIEPAGVYGVIAGEKDWEGSTTAIGLQRPESNFGKIKEIEKTIQDRRRSRYRDTAIVIAIIVVALVFLTTLFVWGWNKIQGNLSRQTEAEVELDNYIGKDISEVEPILDRLGVRFTPKYREDDTVPEGIILDQNPGAGTKVKTNGTTLVLTISGGRDRITIPDYQGQTLLKASTELKETYGFKVTIRYEYSEYERDIVIKTDPAAGQSLSRGETITIYVSEGSPKVTVPDIAGLPMTQAMDLLQSANLVVGPMTNMSVDPETGLPVEVPEAQRVVIKQVPAAGEPALARSVVSIVYGTALDYQQFLNPTPTPIPTAIMPDVKGQPLQEVLDQLTELGFSVFTTVNISNTSDIPEHERIVIRQSIEPDTEIELSQPITLYYGTMQDYFNEINPTTQPTTTVPTTTKPKPKPTTTQPTTDATTTMPESTTAPPTDETTLEPAAEDEVTRNNPKN
jgi:serine/threonine-protein kinase